MVISKKDKKMLECKNDFTFCECVGCSKKRADVGSFQVRNIIRSKFHELEKENEELKAQVGLVSDLVNLWHSEKLSDGDAISYVDDVFLASVPNEYIREKINKLKEIISKESFGELKKVLLKEIL